MTQDPTPYDLLQDSAIEGLQELVTPYYQPPGGEEYSFPVVGQGINSDQYQQMSLAQGTGVIIRDRAQRPYKLVGHGTDAETNQRNTLIIQVSGRTGINEAIINGFYHRMTEDIEIQVPPVTTPTTYYICLTYDPRREDEETGPIRLEVHQNNVPTTHGRVSIILHTVQREPNQLLSQAVKQIRRPYISPTITAVSEDALPDPDSVMYGTVAVVRNGGEPGAADLVTAEGNRWYNLLLGDWNDFSFVYGGWSASWGKWRHRNGGIDVVCRMNFDGSTSNRNRPFALPSDLLKQTIRGLPFWATDPNSKGATIIIDDGGVARFSHDYESNGGWMEANFFIPDYYL